MFILYFRLLFSRRITPLPACTTTYQPPCILDIRKSINIHDWRYTLLCMGYQTNLFGETLQCCNFWYH